MAEQSSAQVPDPLIDEVRQIRKDLWDEAGQDLDVLFERLRQLEAEHAAGGGQVVQPPGQDRRSGHVA